MAKEKTKKEKGFAELPETLTPENIYSLLLHYGAHICSWLVDLDIPE